MSTSESRSGLVLELAEEFLARHRAGERPNVGEYVSRHPDLAEEIREVFPAMAMMENIAIDDESLAGDAPVPEASAAEPVLGQLGDFRIVRELGRGGMGIVYEAEQLSLGRHVALKILPQSRLMSVSQKRRFDREARAAAKLHHTNIVPVFGVGEADGVHYYVMQFIQGLGLDEVIAELKHMREARPRSAATTPTGELRVSRRQSVSVEQVTRSLMTGEFDRSSLLDDDRAPAAVSESAGTVHLPHRDDAISDSGKLSDLFSVSPSSPSLPGQKTPFDASGSRRRTYWHSVAHIGAQVADALQHAHDQGILHRDIKPSNLLLDLRGIVWVTDFGLAKTSDQQDITHTGDVLGTLRYMPPEAFDGKSDARSDIYSLGLTLFELLCFRPAFPGEDRHALVKQITTGAPPRLDKLNPEVPRDLVTIVHKTIARDAADRYQSAHELAEDLQRFNNDEPIRARRLAPLERFLRWSRRNKLVASLGAALTTVLVIAAVASSIAAFSFQSLALEKEAQRSRAIAARDDALTAQIEAEAQARLARLRSELARRSAYVAQINLAEQAAEDFDAEHAVDALLGKSAYRERTPDIRGWEWFYLAAGRDDSRRSIPFAGWMGIGLWNPVHPVIAAVIPGGVQLFDANTGKEIRKLLGRRVSGPSGAVDCAAWSPEGQRVAAGCHDGTLRVWDADTGFELLVVQMPGLGFGEVCWSPDGEWIAGRRGASLNVWERRTGQEHPGLPSAVTAIAISWRDAKRLTGIASTGDRIVEVNLDKRESVELAPPVRLREDFLTAISWNRQGDRLAIGYEQGGLGIWDTEQAESSMYYSPSEIKGTVQELSWSPDDVHLAAVVNGLVHVVEVDSTASRRGKVQKLAHRRAARTASWSPDGKRLVATSPIDHSLRILSPFDGDPADVLFRTERSLVGAVAWSPDGKRLAGLVRNDEDSGHDLHLWDRTGGELLRKLPGPHRGDVITWAPDGEHLATIDEAKLRIWDSTSGELAGELATALDRAECVTWSPDGTHIAVGGGDGRIEIREVSSGELRQLLKGHDRSWGSNRVRAVAWSAEHRWLASVAHNGSLTIWDVRASRETDSVQVGTRYEVTSPIRVLRWSPDGKRLAASSLTRSADRNVLAWNVVDGKAGPPLVLRGPDGVYDVAWSPDGRRIAAAYSNHLIKLWDVEIIPGASPEDSRRRSRELLTLRGHTAAVHALSWNPRRPVLVSSSLDGTIRRWDASHGYELDRSPRSLTRFERQLENVAPAADDLRWLAETHAFLGEWDEAAARFEAAATLGAETGDASEWFLTPWWIAGYYGDDMQVAAPPEEQMDPWRPLSGDDGTEQRWQPVFGHIGASIVFDELLGSREQVSAYAMTRIYSLLDQDVPLLLGSDEAIRVWLNGELIHETFQNRGPIMDEDVALASLRKGWNTLLTRVSNNLGGHSLVLRLSNEPAAWARVQEHAGRHEEALSSWTEAIAADPENIELRLRRGRLAMTLGRVDLARRDFERAIARHPESAQLWLRVAVGYAAAGEEIPEAVLAGLLERQPEQLASLAAQYQAQGLWSEAAIVMKAGLSLHPQSSSEWHEIAYRLAFIRVHLGDEDAYRELCRQTLESFRDTSSVQIAERTATMCLFAGELNDLRLVQEAARLADFAMEHIEAAISSGEQPPWMQFFVQHASGIAQYRLGHFESAIDLFEKSVQGMRSMPRQPWVHWCMATDVFFSAMAYHQLGETSESRDKLQEAERILSLIAGADPNTDRLLVHRVRSEARELILGEPAGKDP